MERLSVVRFFQQSFEPLRVMHTGARHVVARNQCTDAADLPMIVISIVGDVVVLRPSRVGVLLLQCGGMQLPVFGYSTRLDRGILLARIPLLVCLLTLDVVNCGSKKPQKTKCSGSKAAFTLLRSAAMEVAA